ncbi:MAG: transglutaminase-like domain-containing protein, partial [Candidatus Obscuribacterales bacterium]|nr:transglutaminase-like domain-containing protein [Candidatus Obscuribacterales bacterium]
QEEEKAKEANEREKKRKEEKQQEQKKQQEQRQKDKQDKQDKAAKSNEGLGAAGDGATKNQADKESKAAPDKAQKGDEDSSVPKSDALAKNEKKGGGKASGSGKNNSTESPSNKENKTGSGKGTGSGGKGGDGHSSSNSKSSKGSDGSSSGAPGSHGDSKGKSSELSKEQSAENNSAKNQADTNAGAKPKEKPKADSAKETPKKNEIYTVSDEIDSNVPAETSDLTLFTVACNRTVYFRQGAYDNYDGRNWHVSRNIPTEQLPHGASGTFGIKGDGALGLPASVPAIKLDQKYKSVQNLGERLIFAGKPAEITYAGPAIITDSCGNLKGSWIMVKGFEYSVVSDDPIYDLASMRDEGLPDAEEEERLRRAMSGFLQIPDSQSAKTYEMSRSIAGLQDNWFVQAEKICNHLRHTYKYSVDPKFKTKAKNNVDRFLFKTKTGDCKDFASSFVILCRASGIPARMVVGYTPGDFDPSTGTREVKLKHAHAWAEIYYPSSGWVPFDATPHGVMPARINEEERYFKSMSQKVENTFKKIRVVGGKEAAKSDGKAGNVQVEQKQGVSFPSITINLWDLVRWIPVAILAAALSGPVVLFLKDIKGKIRLPKRMMPASKVYCKLMKDLKPIGVPSNESQTPGEFLHNLQMKLSESTDLQEAQSLSDAVEDFVDSYNATCFGGNGSVKELEQKRSRIGGLIKPFKK